jgi:hypothetical protein
MALSTAVGMKESRDIERRQKHKNIPADSEGCNALCAALTTAVLGRHKKMSQ